MGSIQQPRASLNTMPSCLPAFRPAKAVPRSGRHSFFHFLFIPFVQIILHNCFVHPSLPLHRCFFIILVDPPIVLSICCLFLSPFCSSKQPFILIIFTPSQHAFDPSFLPSFLRSSLPPLPSPPLPYPAFPASPPLPLPSPPLPSPPLPFPFLLFPKK